MWNKLTQTRNINLPKAAVIILVVAASAVLILSLLSFYLTSRQGSYVLIINFTGAPVSVAHKDQTIIQDAFVISRYEIGNQAETFVAYDVDNKELNQITIPKLDKPNLHIWILGQPAVAESCLVAADVSSEFFELSAIHNRQFAAVVNQPGSYFRFELAKPIAYYFHPGKNLNELPRSLYSNEAITAVLPVSCGYIDSEENLEKNIKFWLAYQPHKQRELYSQWESLVKNDPVYNDPGSF